MAVAYFFGVAALASCATCMARRFRVGYRQLWLSWFGFFLASWCGLALLSIVQFALGAAFLPGKSVEGAVPAVGPLFATLLAASLYLLSGGPSQPRGAALQERRQI